MKDKKLLERLEFLHQDISTVILGIMNKHTHEMDERANKLVIAANAIQQWIEEIKKEGVKMTNVEILKESRQLGDVRGRLGATDEFDDSFDEDINELSPIEIVEAYAGWQLGDSGWARIFIELYDKLKEGENESARL